MIKIRNFVFTSEDFKHLRLGIENFKILYLEIDISCVRPRSFFGVDLLCLRIFG